MTQLEAAKQVMQVLIDNEYEVYIVGGFVRDYLLGRESGDIDLATSATPEEVVRLFKRTFLTGVKHGTVTVLWEGFSFEVTTFRREGKYEDHRRPDHVDYVTSFREDVKRRDFTMNALGLAVDGTIVDYVGGEEDIRHRRIRTVGNPYDRMEEDALRMLRAFRFVSILDFTIHPKTLDAIRSLGHLMAIISIERILQELERMIEGQGFLKALSLMDETNFFSHLGFFEGGLRTLLNHEYQPESFAEFLAVCKLFDHTDTFHELPISNQLKKEVKQVVSFYQEGAPISPHALFQVGLSVARMSHRMRYYLDGQALRLEQLEEMFHQLPIKEMRELAVTGHDLMQWLNRKSGPWIKDYLTDICEQVISGALENDSQQIRQYLLKNDSSCDIISLHNEEVDSDVEE